MQLFTFGHPCEHQLRRVCIGGTSCPLNGYPDHWCCSFVKGRINFKRDKPCEGARCRWGFAHPPAASFDAVTLVLQEGRACAAKMEENYGTGTMHGGPYIITSPNVADVAHCALNMLRVPAARIATRVGGLLAFAAVKAGDAKVFTQLLKTMKKPVDDYLIGAFEFIQSCGVKKGSKDRDAALDDLRHDVVSIMGAALCQQSTLVCRPEQLPLQSYYIAALKTATRNKKKFAESLEQAAAMFPGAVDALVPPENFLKAARREEGEELTPELKPATPPAGPKATLSPSSVPASATSDVLSPPGSAKKPTPEHMALPVPMAPLSAPTAAPNSTLASAPKLPPASSAATAKPLTVTLPSLLLSCQPYPGSELVDCNAFPSISVGPKLPASTGLLFGGLFSLDVDMSVMEVPEPGTPQQSKAPLGAAIREAHVVNQPWLSFFGRFKRLTSVVDQQADLMAAAAAISIADAILESA